MKGTKRRLVVRLDNAGDVLLTGPAIRALAADGPVDVLAGPAGAPAAALLPGVRDVIEWRAPWIQENSERPIDRADVDHLVDRLAGRHDEAAVLTSFHQSSLPAALLLRLAGVARIAAVSIDHPGGLIDHRVPYRPDLHEVEQQLLVAEALGARRPDDDRLAIRPDRISGHEDLGTGHVVVHPDASVPARSVPAALTRSVVRQLLERGEHVVVTGGPTGGDPPPLDPRRPDGATGRLTDLRGRTDWSGLAAVVERARVVVTGNTGPAHLAAACGTPVVSIFAPVVPANRWAPWRVPTVVLGDQTIACAGCRSRICPYVDQPCTAVITTRDVVEAIDLIGTRVDREVPA